jgi:predicted RNA binding protein YcfA (HicA-like mRNA interferase family)
MAKKAKLLERLRNNPKNVRFADLDKLLRWHGFECRSRRGSHYIYKRQGCRPISIPRREPVGVVYVKQVLALIEGFEDPE